MHCFVCICLQAQAAGGAGVGYGYAVRGRIAYVSQEAWIQNLTVRLPASNIDDD